MRNKNINPSASIGPNVCLAEDAHIGPYCYIDGRSMIASGTKILGNVTLIGDVQIGSNCIIEPNISLTDVLADPMRRGKPLTIGGGTHIGAGSVLSLGVTIGSNVQIGPGTVIVRDVPSHAIVSGNPAAIVGYKTPPALGRTELFKTSIDDSGMAEAASTVCGVRICKFPHIRDLRGDLSVGEFGRSIPFIPKRYFLVFDVPSAETRGEHAHRTCEQFLVCVTGSVSVVVDDGKCREEIQLDAPDMGLYIPPKIWALQYKYSPSAVLLVFASHYYDAGDYIRRYDQFQIECGQHQ